MIQAIQKSGLIDVHPLKERNYLMVVLSCIVCVLHWRSCDETDGFVMSDPIPDLVYFRQLIEDVFCVVCNGGCTRKLVWENVY